MRIFHLFPGEIHHLIPEMIKNIIEISRGPEHGLRHSIFIIFDKKENLDEEIRVLFDNINLSSNNLIFIDRKKISLLKFFLKLKKSDCIVLHSSSIPNIWPTLFLFPTLWKRTAWLMWGADIYGMANNNVFLNKPFINTLKNILKIKTFILERILKIMIPRLGAISALIPKDFEFVNKLFGECNNYVNAVYGSSFPIFDNFQLSYIPSIHKQKKILIGNSAALSNNHLEILDILSKYKDEDIEVYCPLGYAGNNSYKNKVVEAGSKIFDEKFIPILEIRFKENYLKLLAEIDILVFNHNRQQGLFNLYFIMYNRKMVFLRNNSSTYKYFLEQGIITGDTCKIKEMKFSEFISPYNSNIAANNADKLKKLYSKEIVAKGWSDLISMINRNG